MSAPESNSKGRPSLLSEPTANPQPDDSRILANLEGRVAPPPQQRKRSRVMPAVVAVLVIALGGWGAWLVTQRSTPDGAAKMAAVSENAVRKSEGAVVASDALASTSAAAVAASGSTLSSTSSDGASAATVVAAGASGASAGTAATIVAEDDAAKAAQSAQPAQPASDDASRLSRALSEGTEPAGKAASAAVSGSKPDSEQKSEATAGTKHGAHAQKLANVSRDRHQAASNERHAKDKSKVAHAESKKNSTAKRETKPEDSDADLLAALVARTKPADPKAITAVAASGPSAAAPTKKVSTNASGSLAERINECSQHGFFEEQLCRWRACDGHWGKDPHCPATSAQAKQP
ncbi:hypothetical protein GCM10027093_65770 [Paraburkholderia jirisanensis]